MATPKLKSSRTLSIPRLRLWSTSSLGLLVFSLAFILRLIVAAPFLHYSIALDDMLQYDMLARSLIAGDGYRWYSQADLQANRPYLQQVLDYSNLDVPVNGVETTFRPPGYPFFLAGVYLIHSGANRWVLARIVQCGLGAALAPLTFLLGIKLRFSRRIAALAGAAVAVYPILQMYPIALASENLFIPLVLSSMIAVLWAAETVSLRRLALAGALMGLAILTRSVIALAALVAALWIARYTRARFRGAVVFLLTAFGLCLPWAIRNSLLSGRITFVETALSYQMYIGYHPDGNGGFISAIAMQPLSIIDDAERNRYCAQAVVDFIRADPLQTIIRPFRRLADFFAVEDRELIYFFTNNFFGAIPQPWLLLIYLAIILPWPALCIHSILGFFRLPKQPAVLLILGVLLTYLLPHLLILAEPRFHLTFIPLLAPFAVYGFIHRKESAAILWHFRQHPHFTVWLVRLLLLTLLIIWIWGFLHRWDNLLAILSPGGNVLRQYY